MRLSEAQFIIRNADAAGRLAMWESMVRAVQQTLQVEGYSVSRDAVIQSYKRVIMKGK